MTERTSKGQYGRLAISLSISMAAIIGSLALLDTLTVDLVLGKLLWPLFRLMIFISIGLMAGQVIEASGWTRTLASAAAPIFRYGNLSPQSSAAFTAAFISGITANAMLLEFFKEGKIDRHELFLANFINQFPAFFLHLPTTFFIVIPLTGWAGGLYFLLTFAALLLRSVLLLFYSHLKRQDRSGHEWKTATDNGHRDGEMKTTIIEAIRKRFPRRMTSVATFVVPIYVMIFVLHHMGGFDAARSWLAGFFVSTFMPVEALSLVILSFAAEFTSGFAAAGALLEAGVLTVKQTTMALLMGNIIAFPIRAIRHQLPRYMGIFSPKMGLQLLVLGQGFRVLSLVAVGVVYYVVG